MQRTHYSSLIASYLYYGLLLWGKQSHKVEILQKKAIRRITGSNPRKPLAGYLNKNVFIKSTLES